MTSSLEPTPLPIDATAPGPRRVPKWHRVYYLLAAFDVLVVLIGLFLNYQIVRIYDRSVAANQEWVERHNDYAELGTLAGAVNAPGNDVFDSHDVARESLKMRMALRLFNGHMAAVEEELRVKINGHNQSQAMVQSDVERLPDDLAAIKTAMAEMTGEADLIFSYFMQGQPEMAGRRMATMDNKYAQVNIALAGLREHVSLIQKKLFNEELALVGSLRKFEYLIAAFVLLMVGGATIYGHKIKKQIESDARAKARIEMERQAIAEIVQSVVTTDNIDALFRLAHHAIKRVLPAENCFIALHNLATDLMHYEYWVDKFDPAPSPRPVGKGFSSYMLRTGQPLLLTRDFKNQMYERGEVEQSGASSRSWLGIPLRTGSRNMGVLVVQDYERENAYSQRDTEFLATVGDQLGLAIERKQIELELKTSEVKYRSLLENIPDVTWTTDENGNTVFISSNVESVYGFTAEELVAEGSRSWLGRIHPDDVAQVLEGYRALFEESKPYDVEFRIQRKDGAWIWLHDRARLPYESGGVLYTDGVFSDITERKEAEEKQKQSDEWLGLILTASRDGVMVEEHGKVVYANKSYSEMLGYDTPEEMSGIDVAELISPAEVERMTAFGAARVRGDSPPSIYEFMCRRKNGSLHKVEASVSTSLVGGKTYISTSLRDIAERKRAEAALQEADRRAITEYERLLNRLASLAQSLGSARDLTTVYRALSDFTIASAPCTGIVIAIYHPEKQAREAVYVWAEGKEMPTSALPPLPVGQGPIGQAIRTGEVQVYENLEKEVLSRPVVRLGTADHVRTRPAVIAPMAIMGRVIGVLEIQNGDGEPYKVEHVTALRMAANLAAGAIENVRLLELERRKEERLQQAQKMESIGTLAGGIAHDFNNILGAILGYSELATNELPSDHVVQSHLSQVLQAANRARESVKQILTFSRQQEPDNKVVNIGPVLMEALDLLRASLPATIEIVTQIDPELPTLFGDAGRIHQVMMNLGTNAVHAMRESGGVLKVRLTAIEKNADAALTHADLREGHYLHLTVSDSGCGIEAQTLERIFEPFFTTKGPGEGTGLGLATVYGIVKEHNGVINVDSQPGEGTTFHIYFPAHEGQIPEAPPLPIAIPQGSGQHVMFVDDEAPLALLGKQRLERLGYQVTTHTSSVEALKAFQASPARFDLVITDYTMPHLNGADLAKDMLKIRPEMPVIMLTGYSSTMNVERTAHLGIRELLLKPTTAQTIGHAVNRALDQKKEE